MQWKINIYKQTNKKRQKTNKQTQNIWWILPCSPLSSSSLLSPNQSSHQPQKPATGISNSDYFMHFRWIKLNRKSPQKFSQFMKMLKCLLLLHFSWLNIVEINVELKCVEYHWKLQIRYHNTRTGWIPTWLNDIKLWNFKKMTHSTSQILQ